MSRGSVRTVADGGGAGGDTGQSVHLSPIRSATGAPATHGPPAPDDREAAPAAGSASPYRPRYGVFAGVLPRPFLSPPKIANPRDRRTPSALTRRDGPQPHSFHACSRARGARRG